MAARRNRFLLALSLVAGAMLTGCQDPGVQRPPSAGAVAPPIEALGWINGPAPAAANSGDVVVIDCFFSS